MNDIVEQDTPIETSDVLGAAIRDAQLKRDALKVGDFAWSQLHGAIRLASWVEGFTGVGARAADGVTRETVARALAHVTGTDR